MNFKNKFAERLKAWRSFATWETTQTPDSALHSLHKVGEYVDFYLHKHGPDRWKKEAVNGILQMRQMLSHIKKAA